MKEIKPGQWLQFACIVLLWLILVYYITTHVERMTFTIWFSIIASAIIVFVPLYKKYIKD